MKRFTLWFLLIMVVLIHLTGCWDRRELDELSIISALGVDRWGEENDMYLVSVQVINPGEIYVPGGGGTTRTPVVIYHETGETVTQAIHKLSKKLPRKIYLSYAQIVILGEGLVESGFRRVLDPLIRHHEIRPDVYLALAKGSKALPILKTLTPIEKIPANKLVSSLDLTEGEWAGVGAVTLDEVLADLLDESKQFVLPGIAVKEEENSDIGETMENMRQSEPAARLEYVGMAAFQEDRLAGWLNEEESKGYHYAQGAVRRTVEAVPCPQGGTMAVELMQSDVSIRGEMRNGQSRIDMRIRAEGNVSEAPCEVDMADPVSIDEIEKQVGLKIKHQVTQAIQKAQEEWGVDLFGFGEAMHRSHPKEWDRLQKHWAQAFSDLPVEISVYVNVRGTGNYTETVN